MVELDLLDLVEALENVEFAKVQAKLEKESFEIY